jgi:hypothetical protein
MSPEFHTGIPLFRFLLAPWKAPIPGTTVTGLGGMRLFALSMAVVVVAALPVSVWATYMESHTFILYDARVFPPEARRRTPTWVSASCRDWALAWAPYPAWFAAVYVLHRVVGRLYGCPHKAMGPLAARFAVPYLLMWGGLVAFPGLLYHVLFFWPWKGDLYAYLLQHFLLALFYGGQVGLAVLGGALLALGLIWNLRGSCELSLGNIGKHP